MEPPNATQHIRQVEKVLLTLGKCKVGGLLETAEINEAWVQEMLQTVAHGTLASYVVSVALYLEHFEKAGKNILTFFEVGVTSATLSTKAANTCRYTWSSVLSLPTLPQIKSYQHFCIDSEKPGAVWFKERVDGTEKWFNFAKSTPASALPQVIPPSGLDAKRKFYLYEEIHVSSKEETKNLV